MTQNEMQKLNDLALIANHPEIFNSVNEDCEESNHASPQDLQVKKHEVLEFPA